MELTNYHQERNCSFLVRNFRPRKAVSRLPTAKSQIKTLGAYESNIFANFINWYNRLKMTKKFALATIVCVDILTTTIAVGTFNYMK